MTCELTPFNKHNPTKPRVTWRHQQVRVGHHQSRQDTTSY